MGIFEKIRLSLSRRARLLAELATIAGGYEALAANLKRHAEPCTSPTIRAGLEQLAAIETTQAQKLRAFLLDLGLWPKPLFPPAREGSNNWERIGSDLKLGSELLRGLNEQIVQWEGAAPEFAARLRELVTVANASLDLMRDLALKCDPQALD